MKSMNMKNTMKKTALALSLLGSGLLSSGMALAEATIVFDGQLKPDECIIGVTNSNLNLGRIGFNFLAQSAETRLPFTVNTAVNILCSNPLTNVYFTVVPEANYQGDNSKFALGDFTATALPLGYYELETDTVLLDSVASMSALMSRTNDTEAAITAGSPVLSSALQYSFADVLNMGAENITFNLMGTLVLPSKDTISAVDAQLLVNAHQFNTSFTVTAVF